MRFWQRRVAAVPLTKLFSPSSDADSKEKTRRFQRKLRIQKRRAALTKSQLIGNQGKSTRARKDTEAILPSPPPHSSLWPLSLPPITPEGSLPQLDEGPEAKCQS